MRKIIFINAGERDNFIIKAGKKIFDSKCIYLFNSNETIKIIKQEKPDYVLINLEKPVNGNEDMMNMLSHYDSNVRLRVAFLEISLQKIILYRNLKNFLINLYNNFFHIHLNGGGMKEAFLRR